MSQATTTRKLTATATCTHSKFYGKAGHYVRFTMEDGTQAEWETTGSNPFYRGRTYNISARVTHTDWETGNMTLTHVKRIEK